ncbi:hypothetical protein HELRODRAFT_144946, partial [Helobdella robusta]|uniref:Fork-head domain-containing protein n=1 Tax=Helobdella robusta TaxID=6412 RepID=T1EJH3_HELRO
SSKPPFSFTVLILMAIDSSPSKQLLVKEIYKWVETNFPYYNRARKGWKNSVRHNLSLSKCFTKVEKDKSTGMGKGSYWTINPAHSVNLSQAFRKTGQHPYHQV